MIESLLEKYYTDIGGHRNENYNRNKTIHHKFKHLKTGTTICGIVCSDGVVLGADTRATFGSVVAEKCCEKLHKISPYIYCAGAGTSADLTHTTRSLASKVRLVTLETGQKCRLDTILTTLSHDLFKHQGHKGCAIVLGGVDNNGFGLYEISPCGTTSKLPFTSMGSGSLLAISVLEEGYHESMTVEQGKHLVESAIRAGIYGDLYSGGCIDICSITAQGAKYEQGVYNTTMAEKVVLPLKPILTEKTVITKESVKSWDELIDVVDEKCVPFYTDKRPDSA